MRGLSVGLILFAGLLDAWPGAAHADGDPLPVPRRLSEEDGEGFSSADFERLLHKLRSEREGLAADWQALRKRNTPAQPSLESEQRLLEKQMQQALEALKKSRWTTSPVNLVGTGAIQQKTDFDTPQPKKNVKGDAAAQEATDKKPSAIDPLAQAHSLFKSRQFGEALATFEQVDLKGKKANERAPILYLKAVCLLHLDKSAEATELLQEVANSRSDPKLADYAQWQLENLRWRRDIAQRLQDIRQRYQGLEKSR